MFSSKRERLLWAWVGAVVLAIYTTLAFAPTVASKLRDIGIIEEMVFASLLLVVATIIAHGIKTRPKGAQIAVALGITAVYLLFFARMTASQEERTHLMEYGIVALFIREALIERSKHRRIPLPSLLAAIIASLLGLIDECIQWVLPGRFFEWMDVLFNLLASVMSIVASVLLAWSRGAVGSDQTVVEVSA